MADVNVLQEILTWSASRHAWQRDALRRLVTKGKLSTDDLRELAEVCKGMHGLAEKAESIPLKEEHIPDKGGGQETVLLTSLTHHEGVNALAKEQTIEFSPSLTVVYGDNAAGKSGYTRILKQACRARGAEEILGNVVSGAAPGVPSSTLKCEVGGQTRSVYWHGGETPSPALGRISVFDRHCASVYVAEKTDVAFRPFGLDVFDKLSDACQEVKRLLEKDRNALVPPRLPLVTNVKEGTEVEKLLDGLSLLTEPEKVKQLATLTKEENGEFEELKKRLADASAASPAKLARELKMRANRVDVFLNQAAKSSKALSEESIRALFEARNRKQNAESVAEELRRQSFGGECLPGSGSPLWRVMWLAAKQYSESEAYTEKSFPFTEEDATCVLCQQKVSSEASERLTKFHEFLTSTIQNDREEARKAYEALHKALQELKLETSEANLAIEELKIEDNDVADLALQYLGQAKAYQEAVLKSLENGLNTADVVGSVELKEDEFSRRIEGMRDRAMKLKEGEDTEAEKKHEARLDELVSRIELGKQLSTVLGEIARLKQVAAYQLCLGETSTNGVTLKSSELTERAVTKQLADSFLKELEALKFKHIEVELKSAGGSRGSLYHRLELKRAPGVPVPQVVSEGEARCLSIASFFAELSTADDASAILFDDPVSSLDHIWRDNVAERLANESSTRSH